MDSAGLSCAGHLDMGFFQGWWHWPSESWAPCLQFSQPQVESGAEQSWCGGPGVLQWCCREAPVRKAPICLRVDLSAPGEFCRRAALLACGHLCVTRAWGLQGSSL